MESTAYTSNIWMYCIVCNFYKEIVLNIGYKAHVDLSLDS